jgi:uncharacterized protein with PIN domain
MARALFRFYEELNDFLPVAQHKRDIEQVFAPPVPVRHLIETLGVPHTEVEVILLNGLSVGLDHRLQDGDRVSVYPMFESLNVTPLLRIRPAPLRNPRFLADAHLGKLAHYLRMLGFDTLFFNDAGDSQLAALSTTANRVLLTRDRALLMHKQITHGCYIHSIDARDQLLQVIRRLDLVDSVRPFSRCMECNGMLQGAEKCQVKSKLPKGVASHYNAFWRCTGCGRIYWKGNHYRAMRDWISALKNELTSQGA